MKPKPNQKIILALFLLLVLIIILCIRAASTPLKLKNSPVNLKAGDGLICDFIFPRPNTAVNLPSPRDFLDDAYNSNVSDFLIYIQEVMYYLNCVGELSVKSPEMALDKLNSFFTTQAPFKAVKVLYATAPTPLMNDTQIIGFIGVLNIEDQTIHFVMIRGTSTASEWYNNSLVYMTNPIWCKNPKRKVHTGFNNIYTTYGKAPSLQAQIMEYVTTIPSSDRLFIAGHSLGGGLSSLVIGDICINYKHLIDITKTYLYGTPYAGNDDYAEAVMKDLVNPYKLYNIINNSDPVAVVRLPYYTRLAPQTFCFTDYTVIPGYGHAPSVYSSNLTKYGEKFDTCEDSSCGSKCW